MPGRTVAAAYRAFIEPIEAALACLGPAKIVTSPGGQSSPNSEHAWNLNGPTGVMTFPGGRCFEAAMRYKYIEHDGGWRVTTLGYMYTFKVHGEELWVMHWHPDGRSHEQKPHLHLALPEDITRKAHFPVPRMTFEDAVAWVIESGVEPVRLDWKDVLEHSREIHIRYRTWHNG